MYCSPMHNGILSLFLMHMFRMLCVVVVRLWYQTLIVWCRTCASMRYCALFNSNLVLPTIHTQLWTLPPFKTVIGEQLFLFTCHFSHSGECNIGISYSVYNVFMCIISGLHSSGRSCSPMAKSLSRPMHLVRSFVWKNFFDLFQDFMKLMRSFFIDIYCLCELFSILLKNTIDLFFFWAMSVHN